MTKEDETRDEEVVDLYARLDAMVAAGDALAKLHHCEDCTQANYGGLGAPCRAIAEWFRAVRGSKA